MKIILTTNIKKLGKIGDLVNVKDGYARNYLLPKKMALIQNKKNLEYYEGTFRSNLLYFYASMLINLKLKLDLFLLYQINLFCLSSIICRSSKNI